MKWKYKLFIALGIDFVDLLLGMFGLLLDLTGIGISINLIRGVLWDGLCTPIIIYLFGKTGTIYLAELVFPDEVDMFIPLATIIALISRMENEK